MPPSGESRNIVQLQLGVSGSVLVDRSRLRVILDYIPEGILTCDAHGRVDGGVEVHRVDDEQIRVTVGEGAQRRAEIGQTGAEALAAMAGDQHEAAVGQGRLAERRGQGQAPPQRVGRNDPCPCGSGKKAKHCHPERTC